MLIQLVQRAEPSAGIALSTDWILDSGVSQDSCLVPVLPKPHSAEKQKGLCLCQLTEWALS